LSRIVLDTDVASPLATLNVADFSDFADHEGLELIGARLGYAALLAVRIVSLLWWRVAAVRRRRAVAA
jgi:hypothetical protein